ncbi:Fe(3+)-hydroxamate ABC transporter permease FhuB [Paenibacillus pinihumi]|uniref:Fe(3+)-hydroxamate ABC transporter permease FhuB n=1 Tax=Paenibacillus pinihumi TaxID=669462 RepID=UPI000687EE33|nr:Fe(3+)-hydroxamate ABC transporter permease FhuB [Paenibacillus pinihumi]
MEASIRPERKARGLLWLLAGLLLLLALGFISLTQGLANISVRTVVDAIISPQDTPDHHLIRGVRMPRTIMALISGAALAIAGALMQTVSRNPLASETTLGVNAGAYLAVVAGTILWPSFFKQAPLLFAAIGGLAAAGAVYMLSGGKKSTPIRMVLSGMIITLAFSSITNALFLLNEESARGVYLWGSGSLIQNSWSGVQFSWPWVLGGLLIALLMSRNLDLLSFQEETTRSLGQRVERTRGFAMVLAVLVACVSVSVVGPIGFIGLVAPHIVRLSGQHRHAWLLPLSALWGGAILIGADTLARGFADLYGELPAGAVTAIIGAPWLIWLSLRTSRKIGSSSGSSLQVGTGGRRLPFGLLITLLVLLLLGLSVYSLISGSKSLSLAEIAAVIQGKGSAIHQKIVMEFRLPRMLVSILAGAMFAASGSLLQSAIRNPLGDAHVLGVTGGAGVGALLLMVALPQLSFGWVPVAAVLGGLAAAAVVFAAVWRKGLDPGKMTLVGIAVSAVALAMINILVIQIKLGAAPALTWLAGSTYGRNWANVTELAWSAAVLLPIGWWLGRRVELLTFQDESSTGLGLKVKSARLYTSLIAVLLAALAVASVGTIGFIGLLAPHAARLLTGMNHRRSIVAAALIGAILLLLADLLGRTIMAPKELPSGVVVALIGSPYLIYLIYKSSPGRRTRATK